MTATAPQKRPPFLKDVVETYLTETGISGNELARRADVATGTVKNIRNGVEPTDLEIYRKLAKAMDKPLSLLLGEMPMPAANAPGDILLLPTNQIDPSTNPRKTFDPDSIAELADDLFARGLLQPLVVRELGSRTVGGVKLPMFGLVAGGRRYRAAGLLMEQGRWSEASRLPCKLIKANDLQALAAAIAENIQREDLDPIEEAEAYQRLIDADPKLWDTDSIAALIHKTRRYVQQRLKLLELKPADRAAVKSGALSVTAARDKMATPKPETTKARQLDLEDKLGSRPEFRSDRAAQRDDVSRQAPNAKPANAVRRPPDPGPIKAGRAYNPHPKAIKSDLQFVEMGPATDDSLMPSELTLWDPHGANQARYLRDDLHYSMRFQIRDVTWDRADSPATMVIYDPIEGQTRAYVRADLVEKRVDEAFMPEPLLTKPTLPALSDDPLEIPENLKVKNRRKA